MNASTQHGHQAEVVRDSDKPCTHYLEGPGYTSTTRPKCGATPTRYYLPGRRCAAHTPAALAGKPEPGADL